jgi:hypothetical protein
VLATAEEYLELAANDAPSRRAARPHLIKTMHPYLGRFPAVREKLGGGKDFASLAVVVQELRHELTLLEVVAGVGAETGPPARCWYHRHARDGTTDAEDAGATACLCGD